MYAQRRSAAVSGGIFALAFLVGLVLVADQAGAFADSKRACSEIFADVSLRSELWPVSYCL